MTLAVVGVFTYLFGRPIRAIDRAISELGRGTFSRPDRHQRAGGPRAPGGAARVAARPPAGPRAGEESIPATHVARAQDAARQYPRGNRALMDGAVGELQSAQREVTAILRENGMKLQRLIENLLVLQRLAGEERRPRGHRVQAAAADQVRAREPAAHAGRAARAARRAGRGPDPDRRPRQGAPDPRQSAVECDQVHAARRHDIDPRPRRARSAGAGCDGQRPRDSGGRARTHISRPSTRARRRRAAT